MEHDQTIRRTSEGGRAARNRSYYTKSKAERDIVLLRLYKGDMAKLDEASGACGLSRAAFARQYAMPLVSAYAVHAEAIAKYCAANGETFETFAFRAFELALTPTSPPAPPEAIAAAMEFDALFGAD